MKKSVLAKFAAAGFALAALFGAGIVTGSVDTADDAVEEQARSYHQGSANSYRWR